MDNSLFYDILTFKENQDNYTPNEQKKILVRLQERLKISKGKLSIEFFLDKINNF